MNKKLDENNNNNHNNKCDEFALKNSSSQVKREKCKAKRDQHFQQFKIVTNLKWLIESL